MCDKKIAPRRSRTPAGRQAETIAAEQLIPRLHCITAVGGVQAARRRPYYGRMRLYSEAKAEFECLQATGKYLGYYETFIQSLTEVLRV